MPKIVIIGAGSQFGSKLTMDIVARDSLQDSHIVLVDIDERKLSQVTRFLQRCVKHHQRPARIEGTTDRRAALRDADFVVTSVAVGGPAYSGEPFKSEIEIPRKYGVDQRVGDTIGPGGVFRFLRTGPVQLEFCRDIEEICPKALLLNYTNPMAMLTWAQSVATRVRNVGLCHSVQATSARLARYIGLNREDVTHKVAGINHQAFFLEFKQKGQDLYPRLRDAMGNAEVYDQDRVRFEMMKHFGYFITESSGHLSEYLPYFRRTQEMRERHKLDTIQVSSETKQRFEWQADPETAAIPDLTPSAEYASAIIEAEITHKPFVFNGNVMNNGLIENLPAGCCVEVPCVVDARGVMPCHIGKLPPQCAALNTSNIAVQELAVRAVLDRDREAAFHSVALDPLTASVCTLDQIRSMFEEMWSAERHLLEWFN